MSTIIEEIDTSDFRLMLSSSIYGQCYNFALALHRGLGWPLIGLIVDPVIIHAGVLSSEGKIWDGRGEISEADFVEPFVEGEAYIIKEIKEEDLTHEPKVKETTIDFFLEKAQLVWPELPWKQATFMEKVKTFADELEALSRKYKLWISGTLPVAPPAIFKGCDDETGYAVKLSADGNAFFINRMLE
ncbi:MAG: hypothetical protein WC906_01540 [Parcubacteria group bacterium]|jgi:hypothetical protein